MPQATERIPPLVLPWINCLCSTNVEFFDSKISYFTASLKRSQLIRLGVEMEKETAESATLNTTVLKANNRGSTWLSCLKHI